MSKTTEPEVQDPTAQLAALPAELAAAVEAGDVTQVLAIRQRQAALPLEIHAAQVGVLRQRVVDLEARRAPLDREYATACAAQAETAARLREAQAADQAAQAVLAGLAGERRDLTWDLGAARRALDAHLAEGSHTFAAGAPVVRSRWQAG